MEDPATVRALTHEANRDRVDFDRVPVPPWEDVSFTRGPGALVLLYAELGHTDERYRTVAHHYLEWTAAYADTKANGPLEGGLGGLAVATRAAAEGWDAYQSMLRGLDDKVCGFANWLVAVHQATRETGVPTCSGIVDASSGLTGIGRYLLHRKEFCPRTLRDVLGCLVTLTNPVTVNGARVPGWWYDATVKTRVDDSFEHGQINFGLAHGLAGPLALLSLAWQAEVRVPGQAEAITTMAEWLLEWRETDSYGPYWTSYIPLGYYLERERMPAPGRARPGWCYGPAGIARALDFAARAMDRPEWSEAALTAARASLAKPDDTWSINDDALCHGWAGALRMFDLMDRTFPGQGFDLGADSLARKVIDHFDPQRPFGYRYFVPSAELYLDLPGFLEGSAGIALALHGYASQPDPASGWDSVLLLR